MNICNMINIRHEGTLLVFFIVISILNMIYIRYDDAVLFYYKVNIRHEETILVFTCFINDFSAEFKYSVDTFF